MPRRGWELRVRDILDSVERIATYTAGMSFAEFAADPKTQDAVIRHFIVIGEAAGHVPEDLAKRYPAVPWRDMRDMRNYIVHAYFGTRLEIVWATVENDLQPLRPLLEELLAQELKP